MQAYGCSSCLLGILYYFCYINFQIPVSTFLLGYWRTIYIFRSIAISKIIIFPRYITSIQIILTFCDHDGICILAVFISHKL